MGIILTDNVSVTLTSFKDELQDGMSVCELEKRLKALDPNDADAVAKEVKRCNNRCNGNDVDVSIKALKVTKAGKQEELISFQGRIGE